MRIIDALDDKIKLLKLNKIDDSSIIARELLCFIMHVDKTQLIIHEYDEIENDTFQEYSREIENIINGKPIQYITHNQEFMGLDFYVDENVLIPQPDTEILVEEVLKIAKNLEKSSVHNTTTKCTKATEKRKELVEEIADEKNMSKYEDDDKIQILDLCTGSGAIAISLDKILNKNSEEDNAEKLKEEYCNCNKKAVKNQKCGNAIIFASDISLNALEVAKKNNESNKTNVRFVLSDLFENIEENKFDIIVSNPPYIRNDVIKELSRQVKHEPQIALDGGEDGLDFYRNIINEAPKYLNINGYLCLEIGFDQKESVINILKNTEKYCNIKAVKDLSGNDRCIIAQTLK